MANRYLVNTGNWNDTANWSASDGGASGASFPVAGDAVLMTTSSGSKVITVNVASVCASLVASGSFTGGIVMNNTLTVQGTTTFISGMSYSGTSDLILTGITSTITSGGVVITGGIEFRSATTTITLADNWHCNGLLTLGPIAAGNTITINGFQITADGGLHTQTTTNIVQGTTNIILTGGTWDNTMTSGTLKNNLTFNGSAITVSGTVRAGTLTYTAGTMTMTGSTLKLDTATLNTSGMTWANVLINAGNTLTLSSDLNMSGDFTCNETSGTTTLNGAHNIKVGGSFIMSTLSTGAVLGTATIVMNGTGNLEMDVATSGTLRNNLTFNTSGTITWVSSSGIMRFNTGTMLLTAGTVNANNINLGLNGLSVTLNLNGITNLGSIYSGAASTITLLSPLTAAGMGLGGGQTYTINGSTLSIANLNYQTPATPFTIKGTSTIAIVGGGTIATAGIILNNTGGMTFAGTTTWTSPVFTNTSNNVTATGSTINIGASCTFAGATTWNNWSVTGTATLTLNALQTLAGTLKLDGATTFAGTNSWTANILNLSTAGLTHTLVAGKTYTISSGGQFYAVGTSGSHIALVSSSPGTRAILTVTAGVSEGIAFLDGTDMDSSGGQAVFTTGIISNDLNWITYGGTVGFCYVS